MRYAIPCILALALGYSKAQPNYIVQGTIISEQIQEVPDWGHYYEVFIDIGEKKPANFIFIGSLEALTAMDKSFSVDDLVTVDTRTNMFTANGVKSLYPTAMKHAD